MLQRIQSLYLGMGFIAIILMFFFPFSGIFWGSGAGYLYLTHFETDTLLSEIYNPMLLMIVSSLTALGFIVSVFLYKNRVFQMRFNVMVFIFNALLIGLMFWIPERIGDSISDSSNVHAEVSFKFIGTAMPLISMVLLVLANRTIKKDEIKVRAADRLR